MRKIKTKRSINPYTGAILTVPAESILERELKQLEKEAPQGFKNAMKGIQEDIRWSKRQQKRAEEILEQEWYF